MRRGVPASFPSLNWVGEVSLTEQRWYILRVRAAPSLPTPHPHPSYQSSQWIGTYSSQGAEKMDRRGVEGQTQWGRSSARGNLTQKHIVYNGLALGSQEYVFCDGQGAWWGEEVAPFLAGPITRLRGPWHQTSIQLPAGNQLWGKTRLQQSSPESLTGPT